MRKDHLTAVVAAAVSLVALVAAVPLSVAENSPAPARTGPPEAAQATAAPDAAPAVPILESHELQGILGKEVVSAAGENIGRIVDVVVDRSGQVRAAVIDFGGFLGVGSRKIAVDWTALSFPRPGGKTGRITLEFTRDQVKAGPEYQDGKLVVVLGAQGKLEPFPYQ
jgi:hypothetical protein